MRSGRLYLAHGYQALGGPVFMPGGTALFPMLRPPCPGGQPEGDGAGEGR